MIFFGSIKIDYENIFYVFAVDVVLHILYIRKILNDFFPFNYIHISYAPQIYIYIYSFAQTNADVMPAANAYLCLHTQRNAKKPKKARCRQNEYYIFIY